MSYLIFQFFLSCIMGTDFPWQLFAWMSILSILSQLHQLKAMQDVKTLNTYALSILSQLHPRGFIGLLLGVSMVSFQFFLSCIPFSFSLCPSFPLVLFQFFLSCIPKFFTQERFICLTFNFIKKSVKLPQHSKLHIRNF